MMISIVVLCRFVGIIDLVIACLVFFFFSSRRRHTRSDRDWSSDVCSSDLAAPQHRPNGIGAYFRKWDRALPSRKYAPIPFGRCCGAASVCEAGGEAQWLRRDRKSVV